MVPSAQILSAYAVEVYEGFMRAVIDWDAVVAMAPPSARARLKNSIPKDRNFVDFATDLFEQQSDAALMTTLVDTGIMLRVMSDPELSTSTEAVKLAEACARRDAGFDVKILNGAAVDRESMP